MSLAEHLEQHQTLLVCLGVASLVFVVMSLALIPVLIARLPADHFAHETRKAYWLQRLPAGTRVAAVVAKNVLGVLVVACGVLMLVLPGQGLLTLLLGLSLVDFPGKRRLERWLLERPSVLRGLNWLRRRMKKAPFAPPPPRA